MSCRLSEAPERNPDLLARGKLFSAHRALDTLKVDTPHLRRRSAAMVLRAAFLKGHKCADAGRFLSLNRPLL
jgi:hypothetical protein